MVDHFGKFALLVVLALAVNIAQADSYPPGDNAPILIGEKDGSARIYYVCVDYRNDDGVMQCGKSTVELGADCYYQEISKDGTLYSKRFLIPCKSGTSFDDLELDAINPIYEKYESELVDTHTTPDEDGSIVAVSVNSWVPTIRKFENDSRSTLSIKWNDWLLAPSGDQFIDANSSWLVLTGRACRGDSNTPYEPPRFVYTDLPCIPPSSRNGKFSLAFIDRSTNVAQIEPVDEPRGNMGGDIASGPVIVGNAVFVGWAKAVSEGSALAISSWTLPNKKRCDWAIDQPGAIDPPTNIGFLLLGDKLLAAYSRDGIITLLKIDPVEWTKSCGREGVTVTTIPRIR